MTKKILSIIVFIGGTISAVAKEKENTWKPAVLEAVGNVAALRAYSAYTIDLNTLHRELAVATVDESITIVLPTPDGGERVFRVWEAPMMESQLAAKYPGIKTYRAAAADDPTVTARMDITRSGFHAMVYDGANTYLVDPAEGNAASYVSFYKSDYIRGEETKLTCNLTSLSEEEMTAGAIKLDDPNPNTPLKVNGTVRRSFRLALGATVEYSIKVAGTNLTKAAVLSAMVTTMNRVNGVYEKEVGVTMVLVNNTDDLIFLAEPDPYTNSSGNAMLSEHQIEADAVIGSSNYDIGHVFSTGGGGIANLACVCKTNQKARGVTGQPNPVGDPFDIDYVAHEMGHQFGATHSFNANSSASSCTNNAVSTSAYEPGGGSTIMAYAGICGSANNIASRSDDYFHLKSLDQITNYLTSSTGATCATVTASGNTPPVVPPFSQSFNIPFLTPFELTAPAAVDADHDVLTYCWEQWDLGDFGANFANTNQNGPIFRSFKPVESPTRVFPTLEKLLSNVTSYLGEKLPSVARTLSFRLTVRDVLSGYGTFNAPNDEITLNVINTGTPFAVTAPNTASDYWQIGSNVTVTWDVSNTTAAPINCSNVDILLSVDGGYNYTFVLASATPNDGNETITVPFAPTLTARVKVKGSGNVFFDLSNANFKINTWPVAVGDVESSEQVDIYPVPARDALNIYVHNDQRYNLVITNTLGQTMLTADVKRQMDIDVAAWARGVYHIQLLNAATKERLVRKIVLD